MQLAAVLLARPSLLIIDESSLLCSDMEPEKLFHVLRQLNAQNTAVIYITHNIREAIEISDRIFILKNGVSVGIYERGPIPRTRLSRASPGRKRPRLRKQGSRRMKLCFGPRIFPAASCRMCPFMSAAGKASGITGLLDAGKTELLNILSGMKTKYQGQIFVGEREVFFSGPYDAMKYGIGYAPEDRNTYGFIPSMTVKENVTLSSLKRVSTLGWIHRKGERYFAEQF